ncbi:MAG: hypothetical protein AAF125_27985, partial [Chloroflexota bacterium]
SPSAMTNKRKPSPDLNTRRLSRLNRGLRFAWNVLWLCVGGFMVMIVVILVADQFLSRESPLFMLTFAIWLLPMFGAVLAMVVLLGLGFLWLLERGLQRLETREKPKR